MAMVGPTWEVNVSITTGIVVVVHDVGKTTGRDGVGAVGEWTGEPGETVDWGVLAETGLERGDAGGETIIGWAGDSESRVESLLLTQAYTI